MFTDIYRWCFFIKMIMEKKMFLASFKYLHNIHTFCEIRFLPNMKSHFKKRIWKALALRIKKEYEEFSLLNTKRNVRIFFVFIFNLFFSP
jgi:hypothetical protein